MPRGARIDAAGVLHHVMVRGIERRRIFNNDEDRVELLGRLEAACEKNDARVYAWCLMPNHFHLAIRTGEQPLSKTMRSVLTGYAMYFNRRNKRHGHLFQNRYKSLIVDEEQYFLALVRYIHLNPMRARIVGSVEELSTYPWTGHAALMGQSRQGFHDADAVLRRFWDKVGAARKELVAFMNMAEAKKDLKTFEGGGLRRSAGGTQKLLEAGGKDKWAYDERILGSSSFVESMLKATERQQKRRALSQDDQWSAFDNVTGSLCEQFKVEKSELLGGSKRRKVSEVRQLLAYCACRSLGLTATDVARVLGVSRQGILQSIVRAEETWEDLSWLSELSMAQTGIN